MKVCVIQPPYSMDFADAESCFAKELEYLDKCDQSLDLIVLPEYCDVPVNTKTSAQYYELAEKFNPIIAKKCKETAKRCRAMLFANYGVFTEKGLRNTTHAFDREGREVGLYFKAHPAPSEIRTAEEGGMALDCSYADEYAAPMIVEMEGLRFAFLTCYDFYMYEMFPAIARLSPDIIIGCSHQRTDTHDALSIIGKFLCYNTNAYLVRSAVSMGVDSPVCGCSMVVSPEGKELLNMKNDVGLGIVEIDPSKKYLKPAGFGGGMMPHWQYVDQGRRPYLYRPCGSMMLKDETHLPYPRICAHRGFSTIAPENSMPAFGAAIGMGAEEIEFDLWDTKDGELVSIHDPVLDRVSNGRGKVWDYTLEELRQFDFGSVVGETFEGLRILTFEEILKKLACTCIMNIHVKFWDFDEREHYYGKISGLLRQYGAEHHCYMMASNDKSLSEFHALNPDIAICVGWNGEEDPLALPRRALAIGASKVQLFKYGKEYFDQSSFDMCRENGIRINVFYSDDPDEAKRYMDMGADCILTNDYHRVAQAVAEWKKLHLV